jgi:hypothetical protein
MSVTAVSWIIIIVLFIPLAWLVALLLDWLGFQW